MGDEAVYWVTHIVQLVNADAGSSGARFVCCSQDGCNWSLDYAVGNLAVTDSLLATYLPYILGVLLLLALLLLLVACCCCGTVSTARMKGNSNRRYSAAEGGININERYV